MGEHILIVDDEAPIRDLVAQVLGFEGYPVKQAADGAEALQAVDRDRPSLVLLDMRMPVLDGWGFAAELQQRGVDIPIVVMTAARDAQRWSAEIRADAYLAKPFDLGELLETVEQFYTK